MANSNKGGNKGGKPQGGNNATGAANAPQTGSTAPESTGSAGTAVAVSGPIKLPAGFTAKRQVILPTLNLKPGEPRVLLLTQPMAVSTYVEKDEAKKKEKPATVCAVGDVTDGMAYNLLVPAVLESTLREAYPNDSYVGLTFYMEKLPKRPGKRYFDFKLVEAEATTAQ